MKRPSALSISFVALLSLALSLASCGIFEGTSLEGRLNRLGKDAQRLAEQIKDESDPDKRKTLEKDLQKVQENLESAFAELKKQGKDVDIKGFFSGLGKSIENLGDQVDKAIKTP